MEQDQSGHGTKSRPGDRKRSLALWGAVGALLLASVMPCPECGGSLSLHLWPLIPFVAVLRLALRRTPKPKPEAETDSPAHAKVEEVE